MNEHHFDIFADYFQFYLSDERAVGLPVQWDQAAIDRMLSCEQSVITIGTARNMTVPVSVLIRDDAPPLDLARWDRINECSLYVPSGRVVIAGCSDYFPDAARIAMMPGFYRVRVYYGSLDSLSVDGLEGNDHYLLILWPSPLAEMIKLKSHSAKP